jgi:sulfate adenylyltransferase subunit 1
LLDGVKTSSGQAKYFVQHNTNRVLAKIDSVKNLIAISQEQREASQLSINEIGEVNIKLSKAYTSMLTMTTNQMVLLS